MDSVGIVSNIFSGCRSFHLAIYSKSHTIYSIYFWLLTQCAPKSPLSIFNFRSIVWTISKPQKLFVLTMIVYVWERNEIRFFIGFRIILFFRYSKHEIIKLNILSENAFALLPTNRYIIHFYFIAIAIGWFDCNVNFLFCVRIKLLGSYSKYNRSIWIFFLQHQLD